MEGLETMLNSVLHLLQQLHSRRVEVLNWPACLQFTPFTKWEHLAHHETKNRTKKTQDCWADNNGTFPSKMSSSWFLSFQMFMDWMPHSGTHRPVLTFLIRVAMKCYFFSFKTFGLFSRFYCEYIIGVYEICKTKHPNVFDISVELDKGCFFLKTKQVFRTFRTELACWPLNCSISPVGVLGRPFRQISLVRARPTPQLPSRKPTWLIPAS